MHLFSGMADALHALVLPRVLQMLAAPPDTWLTRIPAGPGHLGVSTHTLPLETVASTLGWC